MRITDRGLLNAANHFKTIGLSVNPAAFNKAHSLARFIALGGLDGLISQDDDALAESHNLHILRERNARDVEALRMAEEDHRLWLEYSIREAKARIVKLTNELEAFNSGDRRAFKKHPRKLNR